MSVATNASCVVTPARERRLAFFAHVGGFVFGAIVARLLVGVGRIVPQDGSAPLRAPA